jgi:hypothetical protein
MRPRFHNLKERRCAQNVDRLEADRLVDSDFSACRPADPGTGGRDADFADRGGEERRRSVAPYFGPVATGAMILEDKLHFGATNQMEVASGVGSR